MSALLFRLSWRRRALGSLPLRGWSDITGILKIRSRRDEPLIITIVAKWKCSNVCSWGILIDRTTWTLFLHDPIHSIKHSPSIFIVQFFNNKTWTLKPLFNSLLWQHEKTKSPALPLYLSKGWKGGGLWCPLQSRIGASQSLEYAFFACLS